MNIKIKPDIKLQEKKHYEHMISLMYHNKKPKWHEKVTIMGRLFHLLDEICVDVESIHRFKPKEDHHLLDINFMRNVLEDKKLRYGYVAYVKFREESIRTDTGEENLSRTETLKEEEEDSDDIEESEEEELLEASNEQITNSYQLNRFLKEFGEYLENNDSPSQRSTDSEGIRPMDTQNYFADAESTNDETDVEIANDDTSSTTSVVSGTSLNECVAYIPDENIVDASVVEINDSLNELHVISDSDATCMSSDGSDEYLNTLLRNSGIHEDVPRERKVESTDLITLDSSVIEILDSDEEVVIQSSI